MNRTVLLVVSLGLVLVACRGGASGDDTGGDDAPPSGQQHIQDVQNDTMQPGTAVSLKGVIVTAIDSYGAKTGDFWVEEPEGGEFSGVHVFGAPIDQIAGLAVGDIVDVAGAQKDEFALMDDMTGRTLTELKPVTGGVMSVTKTGTGTVPAPHLVDALAIGMLDPTAAHPNAQDLEWEKWEGVLITVSNVAQTSSVRNIGSGATADPTFQKFGITGNAQVETSLAAFPSSIDSSTCYMSITGVGDYFFDYLLFPRTTDAVVAGGTGCPAQEATHTYCSDGLDNDGDGFTDCADFSCQSTDAACSTPATVTAVQMGTATGAVTLTDVIVTAVASHTIWVADALAGAQYNGVAVFLGGSNTPDVTWVIGSKISVIGNVSEFDVGMTPMGDKLTEITNATINFGAGAAGMPSPATSATAETLGGITTGEPWEGVLVRLSTLKVVNNALPGNKVQLVDNSGHNIIMDDDVFQKYTGMPAGSAVLPAVGTCFANLTGVMSVQLSDDVRTINPRQATDMAVGTGCN